MRSFGIFVLLVLGFTSAIVAQIITPLPNGQPVSDSVGPYQFGNYTFVLPKVGAASLTIKTTDGSVAAFAAFGRQPTFQNNDWKQINPQPFVSWDVPVSQHPVRTEFLGDQPEYSFELSQENSLTIFPSLFGFVFISGRKSLCYDLRIRFQRFFTFCDHRHLR
jgi:hypothetical protein